MSNTVSKFSVVSCATALSLFTAGVAFADDKNWSGLYAGGHIGYGIAELGTDLNRFVDEDFVICSGSSCTSHNQDMKMDDDANGLTGGVHLGYNIQNGRIVWGVEGGFSLTDNTVSAKFRDNYHTYRKGDENNKTLQTVEDVKKEFSLNYLASLRGRIGVASDNYLVYLTGGVAFTEFEYKGSRVTSERVGNALQVTDEDNNGVKFSETGFVVGGGGEYMMDSGAVLRGEVLHYGFDDYAPGRELGSTVVRTGISYKFN